MPLASSRSSIESAVRKGVYSIPDSNTAKLKASRKSLAVKRRASLRAKHRRLSLDPSKEKENAKLQKREQKRESVRSPGPTPYWMVAQERKDGAFSPRLTRSATKKKASNRSPLKNSTEDNIENGIDNVGVGVVLNFSPPDQEANKIREEKELAFRENARDARVQLAKENKQLLLFSPSGRPLQDFEIETSERNKGNENAETLEQESPPPKKLLFADNEELLRSLKKAEAEGVVKLSEREAISLKTLQEKIDLLLESKTRDSDTREEKEKVASLEIKNEHLEIDKKKLEKKVDALENEKKILQVQIMDMKDQVLESKSRVENDVTAVRREATNNLEEKQLMISKLEKEKSELMIDQVRMESEINSLRREGEIRLEGLDESRRGMEYERERLGSRVQELELELTKMKERVMDNSTNQSKLQLEKENLASLKSQLENQIEQYKNKNHDLQDKVEKLKENIFLLKQESNSEADTKNRQEIQLTYLESLKTELDEKKTHIFSLEKSLENVTEEKKILSREKEIVSKEKEEERLDFQKLNEESSKAFSRLEQELMTKDEKILELVKQAEHFKEKLKEEEDSSNKLKERLFEYDEKTQKSKQMMSKDFDAITVQLHNERELRLSSERRLSDEIESQQNNLEKLEVQVEKLEHQLDLTNAEKNIIDEQLQDQKKHNNTLLRDQEDYIRRESETSSTIEKKNQRIDEMTVEIKSIEEEILNKDSEICKLERELAEISSERDDIRKALRTFDDRENNLHLQLRQSDRIRRELHNKVMQLSGNIRVYVRVRPELPGERNKEGNQPVQQRQNTKKRKHVMIETTPFNFPGILDNEKNIGHDLTKNMIEMIEPHKDRGGLKQRKRKWKFGFDNVFTPNDGQKDIWEATEPLVQSAIDGYNVCIFAYGQTGSGKTYTMLGDQSNEGIISRAVDKLFSAKKEMERLSKGKTSVKLSVELLEIYNETVRDLLAPKAEQNLRVTSNEVSGNMLVSTSSSDEVMEILELAQSRRCVKATKSNNESSRSHMVFTIHYSVSSPDDDTTWEGKLHVCDLAGSERLNKSGANSDGSLLKETQSINSSLSVLSNVIERLQQGNSVVPFRESKLTMILQNSLGGNSKTLAIVCCNPLVSHFHESLCSLKFADKVNKVELKATSNFSC